MQGANFVNKLKFRLQTSATSVLAQLRNSDVQPSNHTWKQAMDIL